MIEGSVAGAGSGILEHGNKFLGKNTRNRRVLYPMSAQELCFAFVVTSRDTNTNTVISNFPCCNVQAAARHLLEKDIFFVAEKEVDLHIWKIVYYQVIEMLKAAYLDTENTGPDTRLLLKSQLLLLFEEGADYYNQLLIDLGKAFNVDLDRFYDALEPRELSRCGRSLLIFMRTKTYHRPLRFFETETNVSVAKMKKITSFEVLDVIF